MVFVYLFRNLFLTVYLFFKHYFVDSFNVIFGQALGLIRSLERRLALKINFRFLFVPLYQEYNIYGYLMGFLFRTFRIITGFLGYLIIMIMALLIYLAWAGALLFIIYKIVYGS